MILPAALKPGDRIRIVAPARKISLSELEPSLNLIESWGFEAFYTEDLFAEENQFAGSDEIRSRDLQAALDDPDCRAILCARGGYGCVRIVDRLNFEAFSQNPKWLIGYSDITVFHSTLHNLGFSSLHATMPGDIPKNTEQSKSSLKKALCGEAYSIKAPSHPFNKAGLVKAPIVGGNISMLYSLLGSPEKLDLKGKILFLEDLDEYLYHVDRMLFNIKRNGYLKEAAGIIIGSLSDMNDNRIPFGENAEEILHRHFQDLEIPIAFKIPAGHLSDNQTLIFGLEAELSVDSRETIIRFSHEQSGAGAAR